MTNEINSEETYWVCAIYDANKSLRWLREQELRDVRREGFIRITDAQWGAIRRLYQMEKGNGSNGTRQE